MLEGNIEFCFVRKFECEHFLFYAARRWHGHELEKTSNAMFEMNDEIAFVQLAEIDLCAIATEPFRALQSPATMRGKSSEQFGGRKDNEISIRKTKSSRQCAFF